MQSVIIPLITLVQSSRKDWHRKDWHIFAFCSVHGIPSSWDSDSKTVNWWGWSWLLADCKLIEKGLQLSRNLHFGHLVVIFLQNLISAIDFLSENNPQVEVSATLTNAFSLLKITSSFHAAFPSASNSRQPNLFIFLDSEYHELFKNAFKRLGFDWDGG